jgi:hypothetical protein
MNVAGFFVAWRVRDEVAQTRQKSVVTLEGYRSVQSWPFMVNSRARLPSRWTIRRQPSCLISRIPLRAGWNLGSAGRQAGLEGASGRPVWIGGKGGFW